MEKARARIVIVVVLLVVLAGVGIGLWTHFRGRGTASVLVLHGNVDIRQVDLAFNGSERIAHMPVQEGDRVTAGQLLAELDTRRLQLAAERAAAQVEAQKQNVARLEAGSRPEEIRQAQAQVDALRVETNNAELNYKRQEALAKEGATTNKARDDAKTIFDNAAAQLKVAEATLALAVVGPRQEDIEAAKATLAALQADLALARQLIEDAGLRAPSDGVIRDRLHEPGDMVNPQTPVYTLALTDPIWVRAYVSEAYLGRIHPGMQAEVTTDSFPEKRYSAWVGYISPAAEFTPKSVETAEVRTTLVYQVRIYVKNPENELRLGMPATVHIDLGAPVAGGNAEAR